MNRIGHRVSTVSRVFVAMTAHSAAVLAASPSQPTETLTARELSAFGAIRASADLDHPTTCDWVRQQILREEDVARYGLRLEDGWQKAPIEQPLVIVVHGFNSSPVQNEPLLQAVRAAKLPCGTFAYPNDHTILASAELLSCELRSFAIQFPRRRIALVCHSMGGLVARVCLEEPRYDPGNVERLIMIAPPTHGSMIAHFAVGTDIWEHWISRRDGGPWRRLRDSIVDGLGEAADELCPGSAFLCQLNGRPLNPRVRYTILLGTGARLDEAQIAWIRDSLRSSIAKLPGAKRGTERFEAILNDIEELVAGKGDGIVAVKRGRLEGVEDTIVLPFGHLAVTGEPRDDVLRRVQHEVLQRVQ